MIYRPQPIEEDDFHSAWFSAVTYLAKNNWEKRNLIVQVRDANIFDLDKHREYCSLIDSLVPLAMRNVAYTIFPHNLYEKCSSPEELYEKYNGERGLYRRAYHGKVKWGVYFRRMTMYPSDGGQINQLKNIIDAINERRACYRSSYTIMIQKPGGENVMTIGGPCLNYIALQIENSGCDKTLGLLAVYRNHYFLNRAYGNYWGLCNLMKFICDQTDMNVGPMTCISSRAEITSHKRIISDFVGQ